LGKPKKDRRLRNSRKQWNLQGKGEPPRFHEKKRKKKKGRRALKKSIGHKKKTPETGRGKDGTKFSFGAFAIQKGKGVGGKKDQRQIAIEVAEYSNRG